ncbi:MAG: hypothetical protein GYB64_09500, partial [Chloroflexi bacterium]|nr:hypothetical protein [Chloroflexota bacterium]
VAAWLTNLSGDVFALPVSTEIIGQPPSGGSPGPGPSTGFNLGGQTQTLGHPGLMRSAGMTWVKFQYKWSPGSDPQEIAGMVNAAHSQGFRVLLSIPGPLYPSSIDFAAYTQFLQGVAGYGPDAIEVWNEMNLNREWPTGQINPTSYVNNMLAPGYRAIKAVNPNILVISGAPAPTGFHDGVTAWSDDRYIAGMAAAGAANYMDCIGVHYNAGATSPDQSFGHPADPGVGHYSWYFWPTYNLYAGTFPGKPVCFTEIGYVSGDGYPPLPSNFAWGGGTSTAEHAQWLGRAAQLARSTGRVRLFIVFNVDFTFYGADDPQAGYAILRPDGSCPACGLLAAAGQ